MITNLTGGMVGRYVCKVLKEGSKRDIKYVRDQTCSDCETSPMCAF